MTEKELHPDFLAAPEENRWADGLPKLAEALRHEAYALKGEWAWYILPRGALVAMRVPPTFQKELRLARRLRKALSDKGAAAWHRETAVFLEQLGCTGWTCLSDAVSGTAAPDGSGLTLEAVYQEPTPLGAKKNTLTCADCGNEFEAHPGDTVYRTARCTPCAIKAGDRETEALRAARAARGAK